MDTRVWIQEENTFRTYFDKPFTPTEVREGGTLSLEISEASNFTPPPLQRPGPSSFLESRRRSASAKTSGKAWHRWGRCFLHP